jgi:hypothetical protein
MYSSDRSVQCVTFSIGAAGLGGGSARPLQPELMTASAIATNVA